MNKQSIKRLSAQAGEIMNTTEEQNKCALVISQGEDFGQLTTPDFTDLLKRWKLSSESLERLARQVWDYHHTDYRIFMEQGRKTLWLSRWSRIHVILSYITQSFEEM